MDRVEKYRKVLEDYLNEFATLSSEETSDTTIELLISADKNHYQLLEHGHTKARWIFMILLHFHLKEDGTIQLFANSTEEEPFEELTKKGVAYDDLEVAWAAPFVQSTVRKKAA